ncbi:MAG TPA: hypothetical protein VKX16_08805 [Chloroflexota bacterium]|nr:hypothetical protein [Chloroflexota bacterium]
MTSSSDQTSAPARGGSSDLVTEQVRQGTQDITRNAQQAAGQVADTAKQQAQSALHQQKSQASDTLHQVTTALRQTSENMHAQNQSAAGNVLDAAAGRIEGVATYLEQHSVPELIDDVERFARRNSALFLGGAFAVGVLAARFLKSSTPQQSYGSTSQARYVPARYDRYQSYGVYTQGPSTAGMYDGTTR